MGGGGWVSVYIFIVDLIGVIGARVSSNIEERRKLYATIFFNKKKKKNFLKFKSLKVEKFKNSFLKKGLWGGYIYIHIYWVGFSGRKREGTRD